MERNTREQNYHMEFLAEYSYPGLFAAAFLAATILPLSSELVLGILLVNGFDPVAVIAVATIGNVLGAVTNYVLGYSGNLLVLRKWLRLSPSQIYRAEQKFQKWGVLSLLLAWAPVIGDPLTVVAGLLKINLLLFLVLVFTGKLARYIVVGWTVLAF